ncbi:hypothetical protein EDD17DRAFT_1894726 [Pisolithus thermaeus]|nr:hypothetical protein EDD17DRAFT_1894726 [Pisolithus thermaeus]
MNKVPQRLLMPSVHDASLWQIRVKPDREKGIVFSLMHGAIDLEYTVQPLQILFLARPLGGDFLGELYRLKESGCTFIEDHFTGCVDVHFVERGSQKPSRKEYNRPQLGLDGTDMLITRWAMMATPSLAKEAHRSASSFSALFSHVSSTLPTDAGPSILDRIESRSQFCTERENEAQPEYNLAYNAVVPSTEALPPIKIACVATPIPIQEIYGSPDSQKAIRADILMNLIPPSVHGSVGVHSEEKTKLVRKEVKKAENAEVEVHSALEARNSAMEARPVPLDVRRWIEDMGTIEDRETVDALMGAHAAEGESLRENWKRNRMSAKLCESSTITYGRKSPNKALRQDPKPHMGAPDAVATLGLPGLRVEEAFRISLQPAAPSQSHLEPDVGYDEQEQVDNSLIPSERGEVLENLKERIKAEDPPHRRNTKEFRSLWEGLRHLVGRGPGVKKWEEHEGWKKDTVRWFSRARDGYMDVYDGITNRRFTVLNHTLSRDTPATPHFLALSSQPLKGTTVSIRSRRNLANNAVATSLDISRTVTKIVIALSDVRLYPSKIGVLHNPIAVEPLEGLLNFITICQHFERRTLTVPKPQPLQLLNQLAPQQHQRDCHQLTTEDSYTNDALQLLDVITVALTTGNPGEVFAAAFDGCQGLTLVLAKNSVVTIEDDRAVHNLFTVITASTTKDVDDVLPFLLSHCQANMEKRIQKMGESVAALLHDLEEVLQGYYPSRFIREEFPRSGQYRKGMHASSFLQMIQHLLKQLTMMIQDINCGSNNLSAQLYKDLAAPARILLRSRLLRFICDTDSCTYKPRWPQAEKLKRRLTKVCQYYHGINNLIRQAKRYCPHGLDYRWVDVSTGTGARTVELDSNYWQAVSRALGEPLTKENIAALCEMSPNAEERWCKSHIVNTYLHPEIRIILHLSDNFHALQHYFPQPIGCSKLSCFACTLWIERYNWTYDMKWLISSSYGKPCATWALPGCSYPHARVKDGRSIVDEIVLDHIGSYLVRTRAWLFPKERKASDEHVEDDDEHVEDDDEHVEDDGEYLEGDDEYVEGDDEYVEGDDEYVKGNDEYVEGDDKFVEGDGEYVEGDDKYVKGDDEYVEGDNKYGEDDDWW